LSPDFIPVHYIWVGPPSSFAHSSGVLGHDVTALYEMWQAVAHERKHQIVFWCLKEYVPFYTDLLAECLLGANPVQIGSIESYLEDCMQDEGDDLFYEEKQAYDAYLVSLFIQLFLREGEKSSIADRVSCKELFSIFLLRSIGGYILDTNVKPTKTELPILPKPASSVQFLLPVLPGVHPFKYWKQGRPVRFPLESFECWVMYSTGDNEITRPMVRKFIQVAGYVISNNTLLKKSTVPGEIELYFKKEDLDQHKVLLLAEGYNEAFISKILHNMRGTPIITTITAAVRRSIQPKGTFFNLAPAQIKLFTAHYLNHAQMIVPTLGIIKTYNNTHDLVHSRSMEEQEESKSIVVGLSKL
jgi:hypothetical protein